MQTGRDAPGTCQGEGFLEAVTSTLKPKPDLGFSGTNRRVGYWGREKGKIPAIEDCTFKALEASESLVQLTEKYPMEGCESGGRGHTQILKVYAPAPIGQEGGHCNVFQPFPGSWVYWAVLE